MKSPFPPKMSFMAKYGSPEHREEIKKHISSTVEHLFTDPKGGPGEAFSWMNHFAASDVELTSSQLHSILDHPGYAGLTHPAQNLARFHFGDLKDEHWKKLATHKFPGVTAQSLAHMMPEHVKITAEQHKDPFLRQLAAGHYKRLMERDSYA